MKWVLLVDDNESDRKLLRYHFDWHGYRAIEAGNGLEGFELARTAEKLDLIVSDALMPVMDGFQLLHAVKHDPRLREIPFIFYSAVYTGQNDEQLALRMGARAFIAKPMGREEFWQEVGKALVGPPPTFPRPLEPALDDDTFMQEYNRLLALRLEARVRELEEANRDLMQRVDRDARAE